MNKIEYKFNIDDKVITTFGGDGIITMLGYDNGGNQYYVKTAIGSDWHKEAELKLSKNWLTEG